VAKPLWTGFPERHSVRKCAISRESFDFLENRAIGSEIRPRKSVFPTGKLLFPGRKSVFPAGKSFFPTRKSLFLAGIFLFPGREKHSGGGKTRMREEL